MGTRVYKHLWTTETHDKHYVHDARPHLHRGCQRFTTIFKDKKTNTIMSMMPAPTCTEVTRGLQPFSKTKQHNKHYVQDARPHLHRGYQRLTTIFKDKTTITNTMSMMPAPTSTEVYNHFQSQNNITNTMSRMPAPTCTEVTGGWQPFSKTKQQ